MTISTITTNTSSLFDPRIYKKIYVLKKKIKKTASHLWLALILVLQANATLWNTKGFHSVVLPVHLFCSDPKDKF